MTEEKKTDVEAGAAKQSKETHVSASPQAIPAIVESAKEAAPVVLSQTPPISPSEPKPVVDKPSSITTNPLGEKK